jgi:glucosylceramidase
MGSAGTPSGTGGVVGASGSNPSSTAGSPSAAGSGGAIVLPSLPALVTSAPGAYWKIDGTLTESTAAAIVTVNDAAFAQKWEGFGAAFNELGWSFLTSPELQTAAIQLLFSASGGAAFAWGRIPIGASDYGMSRYTLDDTGTDVTPDSTESNRPPADTTLTKFSLARDGEKLIPYIKAAKAVKTDLRFWASPWTPPVWMKTGYKKNSGANKDEPAKKPSYFDGGNMKSDEATLKAYAEYFKKFVQGYKAQGIEIEVVSPQNEPGYDQNYPSCLWDNATYTTFIGKHLGPTMMPLGVKVMLGTLSNDQTDFGVAAAALADSTAKAYLTVIGAQWNTLDASKLSALNSNLPVWATEHKCGNYPFKQQGAPPYVEPAPNDQAYGVESWGYIRDAITKLKVTSYNAWNMVLDKVGYGIDTTRAWAQDTLLVVDGGKLNPTPAYYVFRHLSQYVAPGATVVGTTGGDAVAFKNPDGSLIAVVFNSGAANPNYVVAFGAKKFQFAMPSNGWATVKYKP